MVGRNITLMANYVVGQVVMSRRIVVGGRNVNILEKSHQRCLVGYMLRTQQGACCPPSPRVGIYPMRARCVSTGILGSTTTQKGAEK